ncbi:MAG: DUF2306 domain-containing protein [Sulfitobacter sp.]
MKSLSKSEWGVLSLLFVYSFIPSFGGLIRFLELVGGPAIAPENIRALSNPLPISVHVLASFVFCIIGTLQFLPSIRRKHRALHRVLGRCVVVAGCLSAATGLWMTHFYTFPQSLQGNLLYSVRIVLGSLMFGLIIWAVFAIRSRNFFQHSAAMVRAYAIGQGASTQTILGITWIISIGSEATGPMREFLMVGAWVINLVVAEIVISKLLTRKSKSA